MSEIKEDLLEVVEDVMIPEVEAYIEDLHKLIENKEADDETMEEVKEMESFLVELQNIVLAVNENQLDDKQAEEIYDNISKIIEENQENQED